MTKNSNEQGSISTGLDCIDATGIGRLIIAKFWLFCYCNRISGNAASTKNIHSSIAEQLKKNFAKSRWRVRYIITFSFSSSFIIFYSLHIYLSIFIILYIYITCKSFKSHPHHSILPFFSSFFSFIYFACLNTLNAEHFHIPFVISILPLASFPFSFSLSLFFFYIFLFASKLRCVSFYCLLGPFSVSVLRRHPAGVNTHSVSIR